MGCEQIRNALQRRTVKLNVFLALLVLISGGLYIHFLVIRCVEYPAAFDPWNEWEEATKNGVLDALPEVDESVSEDNNNILKWFERKTKLRDKQENRRKAPTDGNLETLYESNLPRTILLHGLDVEDFDNKTCEKRCEIITAKSHFRHADVVVFDSRNLTRDDIPDKKHPNQLYVWYNQQSPAWMKQAHKSEQKDLKQFTNLFDLIMSYRSDSNVVFSSQSLKIHKVSLLDEEDFSNVHRNKSKLIYWMPRDCTEMPASRWMVDIVYQLHVAILNLDTVGKFCSDFSPQQRNDPEKYKFYLHFSSSPGCRDYVDDEVWTHALQVGVVPVIFGAVEGDLRKKLPKNSYISADQFASAYELVNYLEYLDTDMEAYKQFFTWRFNPIPFPDTAICELCKAVYPFPKTASIDSLSDRWNSGETDECMDFDFSSSFKFYRRYFHLVYFMSRPMDKDDLMQALFLCLLIAILALVFFIILNFPYIRKMYLYVFVSTQILIVFELLKELFRMIKDRNKSMYRQCNSQQHRLEKDHKRKNVA